MGWKRAYELRCVRPSARHFIYLRDLAVRLGDLTPSDSDAPMPETRLALQEAAWRLVQGHPPHQYWETAVCALLTLHLSLALTYHVDQGLMLTRVQRVSCYCVAILAALEAMLKAFAYEPLGYLSSRDDACDLVVAVVQWSLLIFVATTMEGEAIGGLLLPLAFVERFGSLLSFYRVLRLLDHWRFARDLLKRPGFISRARTSFSSRRSTVKMR